MTVHTLILIIAWSFIALCLIALFILTYILGRTSVKDNPKLGAIFTRIGRHVEKPILARLFETNDKGSAYSYGDNKVIIVPSDYGEIYYRNKRMIFVDSLGQLVASPFDKDKKPTSSEKETVIYEFVSSHLGSDTIRAIKSKPMSKVLLYVIIAFIVGAIGVFAFMKVVPSLQQQMEQNTIQQSQQQHQTIPTLKPEEIK